MFSGCNYNDSSFYAGLANMRAAERNQAIANLNEAYEDLRKAYKNLDSYRRLLAQKNEEIQELDELFLRAVAKGIIKDRVIKKLSGGQGVYELFGSKERYMERVEAQIKKLKREREQS